MTLPKDHCVQVPWKYIKVCGYSDPFCKNLNQRSVTPRWPLTPHLLRSYVWLYPRIIVSKSYENTSKCVDTVTFFAKKNLNQRSLTPRWPLTPHLLRSHVWLYPRIIVSKSHENTLKYVDTVNLFAKTWTKGHWPLDDLWPHICWGHRCDSTQGSLCPSPMGIHQCMWIQWSILQKLPQTYTIHTYTYYVQNQWSHSLFLNYVQARQKLICTFICIKHINGIITPYTTFATTRSIFSYSHILLKILAIFTVKSPSVTHRKWSPIGYFKSTKTCCLLSAKLYM